jgi:hypothetical protein
VGNGDDDQDDEEPGAGEYRVGQDVLTSVTLHRGALAPGFGPRQLGDERGDCRGDGLALLCFPMSVRKEVYEEPRGHRQPGWPRVVRSGGGRDG